MIGSSPSKPSFFTRVVNKVVPCVTPTDNPPPTEQPRETQNGEMDVVEAKNGEPSSQSGDSVTVAPQHQETSQAPVDDPMLPVPAEVIVPPAAQLLPIEETDGVTSGAVQPPGSTGEQITRIPTNESSDYPDSMTDEEVAMLDEQEEEERLIRNGGNGIPIGPVSLHSLMSRIMFNERCRTAYRSLSYLLLHHSMLAGSAWFWILMKPWFIAVSRYFFFYFPVRISV